MHRTTLANLRLHKRAGDRRQGWLLAGARPIKVAIGRTGIKANKREGDGATPAGRYRLVRLWWRADRMPRPRTLLPARAITAADGWCEDPADRRYNRPIRMRPGEPGDRLRRSDALYDLIIELDQNQRPRIAGRGSAVFVHVARPDMSPTAGCVSMPAATLRRLLARLGPATTITIVG
ncbi:MAG: L,D-transpeptidase family protein [Bradyrhizobiaceae bacterium]|nr:L,D-transpeptidase family protein [Bradyrhizobiaceae bacterium]